MPISMAIEDKIIQKIIEGVQALYDTAVEEDKIVIQETRKEFEGQITVVTFPFTRFSKKTPEQTGADIGDYLKTHL
ncbi:MAG: arginine--tRNA ligase, partial [Daejeonella sp.]